MMRPVGDIMLYAMGDHTPFLRRFHFLAGLWCDGHFGYWVVVRYWAHVCAPLRVIYICHGFNGP